MPLFLVSKEKSKKLTTKLTTKNSETIKRYKELSDIKNKKLDKQTEMQVYNKEKQLPVKQGER